MIKQEITKKKKNKEKRPLMKQSGQSHDHLAFRLLSTPAENVLNKKLKQKNKNIHGRDVNGCEESHLQSIWHRATLLRCVPAHIRQEKAFRARFMVSKSIPEIAVHSFQSWGTWRIIRIPYCRKKKKKSPTFFEILKGTVAQLIYPSWCYLSSLWAQWKS